MDISCHLLTGLPLLFLAPQVETSVRFLGVERMRVIEFNYRNRYESVITVFYYMNFRWSTIASRLPGRTDNEIKNYWNTHIRKRLLKMGIDPVTHSPRLDLLDLSSILSSPLYGSSQMNMYPEILKLASSLFSSSHQQNQDLNICDQNNGQEHHNQSFNPQIQNQQIQPCVSMPFNQARLVESNLNPYPSISSDFGFQQHSQLSDWQHCNGIGSSTKTEDFVPQLPCYNYYNSDCYANNNNQNMSFSSVLSTPSSSPTPLNSNSTYKNGSSITEDETESFVSSNNILRFQIQDMLCVSEFL